MGGRRDDAPARTALPALPPRPAPPPPRPAPAVVDPPAVERAAPDRPRRVQPRAVADPASPGRRVWLAVGLVLAAVATAAVFLTDNPLVLRIVLLAVCWAFVVAAFLGGSRDGDRVAAAAREAELRAAYDLELEREVAARHAHEAELEGRLRRESEETMREELRQLRTQLGALDRLQEDLAAVGRLRADLHALTGLSAQLDDLGELRGELAGLAQLRAQLAGVGDLRAELGRLRSEVTEQLSGEVLVERTVMRAQSVRGPAQATDSFAVGGGRTLEGSPDWPAEPSLRPGGWDVDSWTTTRVEAGPAADDDAPASWPLTPPPAEPTRTFAVVDEEQVSRHRPPSPVEWLVGESLVEPPAEPALQSPREWLDQQSLVGAGDATGELPVAGVPDRPSAWSSAPEPPRRHRRAAEPDEDDLVSWTDRLRGTGPDEVPSSGDSPSGAWSDRSPAYPDPFDGPSTSGTPAYEPAPYEERSYEPPSYEPSSYELPSHDSPAYESPSDVRSSREGAAHEPPSWLDRDARTDDAGTGSTAWRPSEGAAAREDDAPAATGAPPEPAGHARLEQILAESGVAAPSGGRSRRRRYREEGQEDGDDVLARVLGRD
ncbi:hypothetical protein O2W14_14570 [Modestobacter sp. VKM Ac-2986]|uniref:DUF6779 domain-containing protein n=1 Tax=Modestobacter sp. VKM Ac-2986 TaxID=3004140 RepID=UPI0022AB8E05|nr:DUF6779 domain-containing protein [Modestobacter sp. VKM Ac-2986]MCZ2830060.1 hypothetical protein [Modestobacter sp. VKM Ac-2986]